MVSTKSQSSIKERIWCSGTLSIGSGTKAVERVRWKEIPDDSTLKNTSVIRTIILGRSRTATSINRRDCLKEWRLWIPSYFLSSIEWMRSKKQGDRYRSETGRKNRMDCISSSGFSDRQYHCTLLLENGSISMGTNISREVVNPW